MKNLFILFLSAFIFFSCKSDNNSEIGGKKLLMKLPFKRSWKKQLNMSAEKIPLKLTLIFPPGDGPFPALIVIHEWWGLNDWIRNNADAFANKGYAALAIDLYRGKSTKNLDEAHELMNGLSTDRVSRDLQAAFTFFKTIQK